MITLRAGSDPTVASALRDRGLDVVEDAPETAAIFPGAAFPVEVAAVGGDELEPCLVAQHPPGTRLLVVEAMLDDSTAARLEDAGISYVDAAGRAWFAGQERTKRAREVRSKTPRSLRAGSLRLAQLLADRPGEAWTERSLAARGGSTPVTAHSLLKRLEAERLVERRGRGRATKRHVGDVAGLRRWLARNGRPSRVRRLTCFVPDPAEIPSSAMGHAVVLSGAAAAERLGLPVLTATPRPLLRVAVGHDELEEIPTALGGFRTERGANVTLVADPDRLALTDLREDRDGGPIAPPSRVMLDLYLEPRGEAAAEVFLDLWGSKEVG